MAGARPTSETFRISEKLFYCVHVPLSGLGCVAAVFGSQSLLVFCIRALWVSGMAGAVLVLCTMVVEFRVMDSVARRMWRVW